MVATKGEVTQNKKPLRPLLGGYPPYLVWPGLGERVFQRHSGLRIRA